MEVGRRVEVGGNRGTIGYIGPVGDYKGEWVGIDWDDEGRGKHDGAAGGKRYFHARGEKSASFVRISNVKLGRRIDEEMSARYSEDSKMDRFEIGAKLIDFVAMEKIYGKQRDLWKLRCVVLDGMNVAFPPLPGCPPFKFCTELNLYYNLITRWSDLLDILSFFPALLYLNVKRNYMEPGMKSISDDTRSVCAPIFHLVMSECRIDQKTAESLTGLFPKVEQLFLASNGLHCFNIGKSHCNLKLLDLENNPVNDFSNLQGLSALPELTSLNVSSCGLANIQFSQSDGFPALQDLYLRNNSLHGLKWVCEVANLPALVRLFVKGQRNLDDEFGANAREIIIAKLPKLVELDRCEISPIERRSAEILFLDKCGIPPVAEEHKLDIERLKLIHGEPNVANPLVNKGISLLKLQLVCKETKITRSMPASMSVQKLFGMVSRLFHLDVRKVSLRAESVKGHISFELDNPLRSLNFFDLADGDIIWVEKVS